jgi:hypothetical protein
LSPQWDEEFRFDILDDTVLQDEPLLVRVLDDRSSSSQPQSQQPYHPSGPPDESLGVAYVDLNPLLTTRANDYWHDEPTQGPSNAVAVVGGGESAGLGGGGGNDDDNNNNNSSTVYPRFARPSSPDQRPLPVGSSWDPDQRSGPLIVASSSEGRDGGRALLHAAHHLHQQRGVTTIEGWLPLYDTLQGVRGEVLVSIKLNLIGDVNPFRDSSAGVRLLPFSTLDPASGYAVRHIFGTLAHRVGCRRGAAA